MRNIYLTVCFVLVMISGFVPMKAFGDKSKPSPKPAKIETTDRHSLEKVLRNQTFGKWINQVKKGKTLEARQAALQVLRNDGLRHNRKMTLRVFTEALSSKEPTIQSLAAAGLRKAGRPTDPKAPSKLVKIISQDLSKIRPPHLKVGEARLLSGKYGVVLAAIRTLGAIGGAAQVPVLKGVADNQKADKLLRQLAEKAIRAIKMRADENAVKKDVLPPEGK